MLKWAEHGSSLRMPLHHELVGKRYASVTSSMTKTHVDGIWDALKRVVPAATRADAEWAALCAATQAALGLPLVDPALNASLIRMTLVHDEQHLLSTMPLPDAMQVQLATQIAAISSAPLGELLDVAVTMTHNETPLMERRVRYLFRAPRARGVLNGDVAAAAVVAGAHPTQRLALEAGAMDALHQALLVHGPVYRDDAHARMAGFPARIVSVDTLAAIAVAGRTPARHRRMCTSWSMHTVALADDDVDVTLSEVNGDSTQWAVRRSGAGIAPDLLLSGEATFVA